jgi:hypothetical protein
MAEFFRDVEAATQAITPTDPSGVAREFAAAFGPPLTRFKEDLNQIAPPAAVMAWHDKMAEDLGSIAAGITAGEGLNEIARLGDRPLPDFPPEIQPRLAAAAWCGPVRALRGRIPVGNVRGRPAATALSAPAPRPGL